LRKVFFFPGFTENTGGLLREAELLARRDALQQSAAARQAFLQGLAVSPAPGALLISLFAYENPQLGNWLDALAAGDQACHLLVPQGRVVAGLSHWLGEAPLQVGQVRTRG
ncbi:elongation factor P maturation arginine rhamnosyltransferase EarP, partial [Gilvimarinus sp. SDUM040013]